MTRENFVQIVKKVVYDAAVDDTISVAENPPGRRPSQKLITMSNWFASASSEDKEAFETAIEIAAGNAVFGLLAVLDGVRQIEDTPEKGTLELWFNKGDEETLLSDSNAGKLHDLFSQQVPPI